MGLDITAYSKIKIEPNGLDKDGDVKDWDNHFTVYINPYFPGRADGLQEQIAYSYGEAHGFRAGSYSGYNRWREQLAKMAGYPAVEVERYGRKDYHHDAGAFAATSGPFWELINFSDCEGVLGSAVCKRLLVDFDRFADEAEKDSYFDASYRDWHKAIRLGADDGCVTFH